MPNLKSIPFLRILIPYVIGIISFFYYGLFQNLHLVFLSVLFVWIVTFLLQKFYRANLYFKKGIYIISTNVLLFLLAFESCYLYNAKNNINHYSHHVSYQDQSFMATVTDIPVVTERFIKVPIEINFISIDISKPIVCPRWLWFKKIINGTMQKGIQLCILNMIPTLKLN